MNDTKIQKTHWKKNFNYDYLGAYSLNDGQEVTLTIKNVNKQVVCGVNGVKQECTVCYFTENVNGENKPMILNKTNCKTIEKLYKTPYLENWIGKRVTIYAEKNIKAFGDLVEALRIKKIIPKTDKPILTPNSDKWEKAKKSNLTYEQLNKHYFITMENFKLLRK